MQEEAFKAWLEAGGARTESGRNTRAYAVRTIENNLAALGSPHSDLDAAWKADRFEHLRLKLKELRDNFLAGGTNFRVLMPQSDNPENRLTNWRSWLGQYGRFLSGEPRGEHDADRIRQHVLEHYIESAREGDASAVDVLVSKVNKELGLNQQWRNICQAMTGKKFLEIADVEAPEQIGKDDSSATIFRFRLGDVNKANSEGGFENNKIKASSKPTSLILYGPPGTGKTFATAAEAVRLCGEPMPEKREELMAVYRRLSDSGRIEFVTFHQSVSYEDFVEGLRPTQSSDEGVAGFELKAEQGVRIARRAETSTGSGNAKLSLEGRHVFKMSIGQAADPESARFEESIAGGYTLLSFDDIDWSDDRFSDIDAILEEVRLQGSKEEGKLSVMSGGVQMPYIFRNEMKRGDIVVVSKGNTLFRAIGEVTGDYQFVKNAGGGFCHRRAMRWLWVDRLGVPVSEIYERNFMQKSIYSLSVAELNVTAFERYMASQQDTDTRTPEAFVLIIDEINRANISNVFGELMTLLEPDKPSGNSNALKVRLPYSGDLFGVPSNLHIIGTMNTADRSIALLDTALRRRFEFRELMPDASLLKIVDGIDLPALLTILNERIEYLFDREHQIGHAYFMGCASRADVDAVMRHKIIPLLAEYFYEDWTKVAAALGEKYQGAVDSQGRFLDRRRLGPTNGSSFDEEAAPRYRWSIRDTFSYEGFAAE